MKGAGYVSNLMVAVLYTICLFFSAAFMFTDANKTGGFSGVDMPQTFNTTAAYTSNLENQTNDMSKTLRSSKDISSDPITQLNLLLQGGAAAATSVLGFAGIAIAIAFDLGSILLIPASFVVLLVVGILLFFVFQVIQAMRSGNL